MTIILIIIVIIIIIIIFNFVLPRYFREYVKLGYSSIFQRDMIKNGFHSETLSYRKVSIPKMVTMKSQYPKILIPKGNYFKFKYKDPSDITFRNYDPSV